VQEKLQTILWWGCVMASAYMVMRGLTILAWRRPAKARLLENGYRRARDERRRATFHKERPPMPLLIQDYIGFRDESGATRRVTVTRLAVDHPDDLVIWYDAAHPARVSTWGPHNWLAALAALWASYFAALHG
jgi:hypothetical protein